MEHRGRPRGTFRDKQLSPKAKMALKAVVLNAMKHREAARVADIHPAYVSQLKNSDLGRAYISEMESKLDEKLVDTNVLLEQLGREAVNKLAGLMRFSPNDNIVLRAAQDLADRGPTTQKIQRHQVEAFTLDGKDARAIAEAMVEAAKLREEFQVAEVGDYIRIPMEMPTDAREDS